MAAGSIIVELLLKTGSFETDTQRSAKALKQFQKEAEAVGKAIGLALAGIAIAGATAATAMAKAALESIDAFNDLKDATGASIENISAIDRVARETGVGFETVSTALVKLNIALNSAKPDSPTAEALARIGLSYKELRALDPGEALRVLAVRLSEFADDGNKARLVQELFGKSLKDVAPLLNDLATKTNLVASTTTEGALEVEKFRKEIFRLEANSTDAARAMTVSMVTGINSVVGAVREGKFDVISFHKELLKLAGTALSFGQIDFRDRPVGAGGGRGFVNPLTVSDRNEDYGNEGNRKRSVGDPEEKAKKVRAAQKKATQELDEQVKAYLEHVKELARAEGDAAQAAESLYRAELDNVKALEADAEAARELAAIYGLSTDELHAFNREKILAAATSLELLAIRKEEREGGEAEGRLYRQQAAALREKATAIDFLNQKQRDAQYNPLTGAENAVKDYLDEINKAGEETYRLVDGTIRGLEDALTAGLSSKKPGAAARALVDQILSEMYRLYLVKPLLASIFGQGGGLSSILSLFSGGVSVDTGGTGTNTTGGGLPTRGGAATGTNFVERDMLTILHKGEAVVPKAYNPAAGRGVPVIKVQNAPAGYDVHASQEPDGSVVLDMQRMVDARIDRALRPGGKGRRALGERAPDRY